LTGLGALPDLHQRHHVALETGTMWGISWAWRMKPVAGKVPMGGVALGFAMMCRSM